MRVVWEEVAVKELDKVLAYGYVTFGVKTTRCFYQSVKDFERLLMSFPYMGKIEPELKGNLYEYRSFVVHEHFKMIYRLDAIQDVIYIIRFWNVRQEPQSLLQDIKQV